MDIDYQVRRHAPRVQKIPFLSYLFELYRRVSRPLFSYLEVGTFSPAGTHTVTIRDQPVDPFKIIIDNGAPANRAKVTGEYESPVVDVVSSHIDSDTVFWEVGAYCGYYSMAFADRASEIYVFGEYFGRRLSRRGNPR